MRKIAPKSIIIGFKVDKNKQSVIQNSTILLKSNKLDFVVGNTTKAFDKDDSEIWIINKKEKIFHKKGSKSELSDFILDTIKKSVK
jgi:phosphopantothenoylcysteine synthetase/decarboxylase